MHCNIISTRHLHELDDALEPFHTYCTIFKTSGVHKKNHHPSCQHSLLHYSKLIHDFGAPNSLCSSITESKHIKAIKEPWHCSNCYNALSQILQTNQWLHKLATAQVDFQKHGMLEGDIQDDLLPINYK